MSDGIKERERVEYDTDALTFAISGDGFGIGDLPSTTIKLLALRGLATMIRQSRDRMATMAQVREGHVFGRASEGGGRQSQDHRAMVLAVATKLWAEVDPKPAFKKREDGIASMASAAEQEVADWDRVRKNAFKKTPPFLMAKAAILSADAE